MIHIVLLEHMEYMSLKEQFMLLKLVKNYLIEVPAGTKLTLFATLKIFLNLLICAFLSFHLLFET